MQTIQELPTPEHFELHRLAGGVYAAIAVEGGAAGDLDRFLRAVKAGQLLSPKLTEAFLTPQAHYRAMEGWTKLYGYGLWFYIDPAGRVVCFQHECGNPLEQGRWGLGAGVENPCSDRVRTVGRVTG